MFGDSKQIPFDKRAPRVGSYGRWTIQPAPPGTARRHRAGPRESPEGYGAAVDMAFLTEMSNLSPPIIYPPPSA